MADCDDTPVILDIFLWERPENQTIFSIFTGRILVMMNATFVWDGNVHTAMAHSWMRPSQIIHTSVGAIGEINTPEKKDNRDWTKVIVDQKILSEGRESSFKYCHGPYIDIDIAFSRYEATRWHWYDDSTQLAHSVGCSNLTLSGGDLNSRADGSPQRFLRATWNAQLEQEMGPNENDIYFCWLPYYH